MEIHSEEPSYWTTANVAKGESVVYLSYRQIVAGFSQFDAVFPFFLNEIFLLSYTDSVLVSGEVLPIQGIQEKYLVIPGLLGGV